MTTRFDPKTESNVADLPVGIWQIGVDHDDKPFVIVNALVMDRDDTDDGIIEYYQSKIQALQSVIGYFEEQIADLQQGELTNQIHELGQKARLPVILSEIWDEEGKDSNGLYRVGLDMTADDLRDYAEEHGIRWH